MVKKKKRDESSEIYSSEKHPLEKPPVAGEQIISEDDLDKIPGDEEEEEFPPYEVPPPGEGP